MNKQSLLLNKPTIIIAAYNEASVIRDSLKQLSSDDYLDSYQILIVCNGCTDNTEEIVRREFHSVCCHSIKKASKALAIRYAESLNPGFPRLYLDADVHLSAKDADRLISIIGDKDTATLMIPSSTIVTANSTALVKSFYRYWYTTPYVKRSGYGAGTYLLNALARRRFNIWPELVADDAFIRSQFSFNEIHLETSIKVKVKAPRTLWSLLKVKTRSKIGNLELNAYFKSNPQPRDKSQAVSNGPNTISTNTDSLSLYDCILYQLLNAAALGLAKWQFMIGKKIWHRDNSNR